MKLERNKCLMPYKNYVNHMIKKNVLFYYYKNLLSKTENFSIDELNNYKEKQLEKIIAYSYKYVPYYKKLFNKNGINPKDIKTLDDLKKIPYLDKNIVRDNFADLISKKCIRKFCREEITSGTTGEPTKFLRDISCVNFEQASLSRFWENSGDKSFRRVVLRGNRVAKASQTKPPFWEYNSVENEVIMSTYHMAKYGTKDMIQEIIKFKPIVLYAYPSTAYMLAKLKRDEGYDEIDFKYVFTSSEMLMPHQRELICKEFNCQVFDWYGQSERVSAVYQCSHGNYHVAEDYSITELIDTEEGTEIAGTSLFNYAMPLIRFKTGDIVHRGNMICDCGSNFRIIEKIEGRNIDYIISITGERIPSTLMGGFTKKVSGIDEFQIVQEKIGEIKINIVRGKEFRDEYIELIKNDTHESIGFNVNISVNVTNEIPMGANCKKKPFINKLVMKKQKIN